ncbi:MAG: hypothetical protein V2I27_15315 [Erythrobacter sp.]|jgi:hypothetical protein|nr:hypothetical protein [Erythrobacter sp.]
MSPRTRRKRLAGTDFRGELARMNHARNALLASIASLCLVACGNDDTPPPVGGPGPTPTPTPTPSPTPTPTPTPGIVTLEFDFGAVGEEWTSDIAEWGSSREMVEFAAEVEEVPDNQGITGLKLAGTNRSDDLAMFTWRRIENLEPDQPYRIEVELEIASNVPEGCVGVGGAPGESVYIKAGASAVEPEVNPADQLLNLDKGNQSNGGENAVVIGDLAVPGLTDCGLEGPFALDMLTTEEDQAPVVTSDENGNLWLILLSDSGFEARSIWYLVSARFTLTAQD